MLLFLWKPNNYESGFLLFIGFRVEGLGFRCGQGLCLQLHQRFPVKAPGLGSKFLSLALQVSVPTAVAKRESNLRIVTPLLLLKVIAFHLHEELADTAGFVVVRCLFRHASRVKTPTSAREKLEIPLSL